MGLVNLPYALTAGQPENVNQLNSNLSAITAEVNGNLVDANLNKSAISFFLKLATNADRKVAFGSAAGSSFGGANRVTQSFTHGLGATPVFAVAIATNLSNTITSTGQDEPVICSIFAMDSTSLSVRMAIANGATSSSRSPTVYWLAIA